MYTKNTIAIIASCYNKETQIRLILTRISSFVDRMNAANDKNQNKTKAISFHIAKHDFKAQLIRHIKNHAAYSTIASGYKSVFKGGMDLSSKTNITPLLSMLIMFLKFFAPVIFTFFFSYAMHEIIAHSYILQISLINTGILALLAIHFGGTAFYWDYQTNKYISYTHRF